MKTKSFASAREKIALQVAVLLAAMVPIIAGGGGVIGGAGFFGLGGSATADSHLRYFSGLLLGIGLMFAISVYRIEYRTERFQLLGSIVVLGGVARFLAAFEGEAPHAVVAFALVMELGVTPVLCAWQARVAHRVIPDLGKSVA